MAKRTFTNEQLVQAWAKAKAKEGGTRRDVVLELLAIEGKPDTKDNYRKCYNNVNQRVKQLQAGTPAVTFPALAEGVKGARRSVAEMAQLQAMLNGETTAPATTETAPAPTDESAPTDAPVAG